MRVICLLFLIAFGGAVAAFAYFNREVVAVRLFDWSVTASLAAVAGAAYLLGMLSGWAVVGLLRRSISRVAEPYRGESARHF
jgi:lipopolysaccharide assembly protein A